MSSKSYYAAQGETYAKIMLAQAHSGLRTAHLMIVLFFLVIAYDFTMFVITEHWAYLIGCGIALTAIVIGLWLRHRHGSQIDLWTRTLGVYEANRVERGGWPSSRR